MLRHKRRDCDISEVKERREGIDEAAMHIKARPLLLLLCCLCLLSKTVIGMATTLGGITDSASQNDLEIENLGRYAVEEYNKKQNALLVFDGVVKVREQVVAGMMYYITLEATDGGKKRKYEAKVWVKPWLNFKELQDFKPVDDEMDEPVDPCA